MESEKIIFLRRNLAKASLLIIEFASNNCDCDRLAHSIFPSFCIFTTCEDRSSRKGKFEIVHSSLTEGIQACEVHPVHPLHARVCACARACVRACARECACVRASVCVCDCHDKRRCFEVPILNLLFFFFPGVLVPWNLLRLLGISRNHPKSPKKSPSRRAKGNFQRAHIASCFPDLSLVVLLAGMSQSKNPAAHSTAIGDTVASIRGSQERLAGGDWQETVATHTHTPPKSSPKFVSPFSLRERDIEKQAQERGDLLAPTRSLSANPFFACNCESRA